MVASTGIVNVARLARAPVVPVVFATSRRRVMQTWDRMNVALPFGRGVFIWGEPIEIGNDLDDAGVERERQRIEARMLDMVALADSRVGHRAASARTLDGTAELAAGERR